MYNIHSYIIEEESNDSYSVSMPFEEMIQSLNKNEES